jgi:hypothetical protein
VTAHPAVHFGRESAAVVAAHRDDAPETPDFTIRDATPADNRQLVALAAACPMTGDVTIRIDRGPDFFALNRLEGERWRVGLGERDGSVVGCIAISERRSFANGHATRTGYVGDFKVHPSHRDTRVADALSHYAQRACSDLPPNAPVMITVLAGNRAMERRLSGPRGVPAFRRLATIRTHSIPILWRRAVNDSDSIRVEPADWNDLEEMITRWARVGPSRQLAPLLSAEGLAKWIREAPGLDISSYRLARAPGGRLLGFFAVWDQRQFKQLTVVGYSERMKVARSAFNLLAPIAGAERMPRAGFALNCVSVAHICVPGCRPDVLRALIGTAYNELRGSGCSFMNLGLDTRDPLTVATRGFFAQPIDVNAYMLTTRHGVLPETLDARPMHYEIALV